MVVVIKVVQTGFTWALRHYWVGLFGVIKVAGLDLIPHRVVLGVFLLAFLSSFCCRLAKNLEVEDLGCQRPPEAWGFGFALKKCRLLAVPGIWMWA